MLTDSEYAKVKYLYNKLIKEYRPENARKRAEYHGKDKLIDLGISSPPQMRNKRYPLGWCKLAIDSEVALNKWQGWKYQNEDLALNKEYDAADLDAEWRTLATERKIIGTTYMVTSHGDTSIGENKLIITAESADYVATEFNPRTKRVSYAIQVTEPNEDKIVYGNLITDNEYVPFKVVKNNILDDEDSERVWHGTGAVPVVKFMNNVDGTGVRGHSQITEAWREVFQMARRTMKNSELAREYFATPWRYVLNAEQDMFENPDGTMKTALDISMDKFAAFPAPKGGKEDHPVEVGQFPSNSPEAFISLMKTYAELFSSYSHLPLHRLGYAPANPETAEAIWASKEDLIEAVKMDQLTLKRPLKELAWLIIKMRDGVVPEDFEVIPNFEDPDKVALAAATDAVAKQIEAGTLRPDSELVLEKLGYNRKEIEQIQAENSAITATNLIESLRAKDNTSVAQPANPTDNLTDASQGA